MKLHVTALNNIDTKIYDEAKSFISNASNGGLGMEISVSRLNTEPPLKYYGNDGVADFWAIDFEWIKTLPITAQFAQVYFPKPAGAYRILSCAAVEPKGGKQYSQVVGPTLWTEPVHELCHSIYSFLGITDRVHDIIREEKQMATPAFTRIIQELAPYYSQLEENSMSELELYEMFAAEIKKHEGYFPGSRAYVNNNPGNLRSSPMQDGQKAGFAYFKTYEKGWRALLYDIELKFTGRSRTGLGPQSTILQFFKIYAPAGDNNDPVRYASAVIIGLNNKGLKVTINTTLGQLLLLTKKEETLIMDLIRNSKGEISLYTGIKRHPIAGLAYGRLFDSAKYIQVTDEFYNSIPVGESFAGALNLGAVGINEEVIPE